MKLTVLCGLKMKNESSNIFRELLLPKNVIEENPIIASYEVPLTTISELLNEFNLSKVKMAVSTVSDFDTNLLLISKIRESNKKAIVIVESPTKVKTINKFLGPKFKVLSSMGHLIDLPKSTLGVDIEHGFQP